MNIKLTSSYFSLLANFSYLGTKVLHQCLIGKRAVFFYLGCAVTCIFLSGNQNRAKFSLFIKQ